MTMPTKYEVERIQLIALMAYGIFDGTAESVGFLMRDLALFHEAYSDAISEAQKFIIFEDYENSDEIINGLAMVVLGFKGLDAILTTGDTALFDLAKEIINDIDIDKEYSEAMRNHIFAEMQLRAA